MPFFVSRILQHNFAMLASPHNTSKTMRISSSALDCLCVLRLICFLDCFQYAKTISCFPVPFCPEGSETNGSSLINRGHRYLILLRRGGHSTWPTAFRHPRTLSLSPAGLSYYLSKVSMFALVESGKYCGSWIASYDKFPSETKNLEKPMSIPEFEPSSSSWEMM